MAKYIRTEIRRRQIAEAALEVIAELGLGGFTTRAIAARVDIADGTIFRHFKNKKEIVLAAMDRLEEELFTPMMMTSDDPLERLECFYRDRTQLLGGTRAIGRLVFSEQLGHAAGEDGEEKLRAWRSRSQQIVLKCLRKLQQQERLRTDLPLEALLRTFSGMILSFASERMLFPEGIHDLDAKIDASWSSLLVLIMRPA